MSFVIDTIFKKRMSQTTTVLTDSSIRTTNPLLMAQSTGTGLSSPSTPKSTKDKEKHKCTDWSSKKSR